VIELHWTRDQVLDQIDARFLEDLHRAWADYPPLRRLAAAALGHKPRSRGSKNYQALIAMFPGDTIR